MRVATSLRVIRRLLLTGALSLCLILAMSLGTTVAGAQPPSANPTSASPANKDTDSAANSATAVATLQARVNQLEALGKYDARLTAVENSMARWTDRLLLALLFLGVASFPSYLTMKRTIKEKAREIALTELYSFDPRYFDIKIVERLDRDASGVIEALHRRFELSGFKSRTVNYGHACTRGVVVVPVLEESDKDIFRRFCIDNALEPQRVAFILYARNQSPEKRVDIDEALESVHDNITVANFPATVVSSVLAVGRGLRPDRVYPGPASDSQTLAE